MKKINVAPLAPIFLSASFILAHFLHNIGELFLDSLFPPLIISVIFAQAVVLLSFLIFKTKQKAIASSSLFLIFFFFYGQIAGALNSISPFRAELSASFLLFPLWLLSLFVLFKKLNSAPRLKKLNQFFLATSLIILTITTFQIIFFLWQRSTASAKLTNLNLKKPSADVKKSTYPDIYYIIPDSYSASSSLQKYYGYDNAPFLNFLSQRDFFIASSAASNYPKTFLSLGSSLNMQYLNFLGVHKNSSDLALVDPMMQDNLVVKYLKNLGYHYYHLGSWWGATHLNSQADKNFLLEDEKAAGVGVFNYVILESTALNPLMQLGLSNLALGNSEADQRDRVLYQFKTLEKISDLPGPKFVFAHIISPHEPYVFDSDCIPIVLEQTLAFSEETNYINQVSCINKMFEHTIDAVLSKSKRPVVFIIQSDEGAPFLAERLNPPDSWGQANNELLQEKFPVFEAIRLPNSSTSPKKSQLYPEISPVNLFRVVFNTYFQTGLPLLPDRHYIFPSLKNLYDFTDITDKLR